ncbi:MAG: OmpA family protein [Pseudomonadota bacterium]
MKTTPARLSLLVALTLFANGLMPAFAGNVKMYRDGETPNPGDIAAILKGSPSSADDDADMPKIRRRSMRVIPADAPPQNTPSNINDANAQDNIEPSTAEAPPKKATKTTIPDDDADFAPASSRASAHESTKPKSFALPIQFEFNSARLLPQNKQQLDAVAEGIKLAGAGTKVIIEGHTDAKGASDYNEILSLKRALAVKTYMIMRHGINGDSLRAVGIGKNAPLNPNDPYASENRRVEFKADRG